jgi:hypothetical protein
VVVAVVVVAVAGTAIVGWLRAVPERGCAVHANGAVVPREAPMLRATGA